MSYAFREALISLRRAGRSAAISTVTIAIAFLTLAGFLLIAANLQSIAERWAAAAEMSVYLRDDVDDSTREQLIGTLAQHAAVADTEYVSSDEAMTRFTRDFPELADVAVSSETMFPASIEVRLRTDAAAAGQAEALMRDLEGRAAVADVRYDRDWLARLFTVIATLRAAGLVIAAMLVLGAAFTAAAVVRLSLQARHDELEIMQLVGAPLWFIRGPSIAEGTVLGGVGALLALLALAIVFALTREDWQAAMTAWGSVGELRFLSAGEALGLLLTGVLVGGATGAVVSRATVR